jgi:hypothetical protein
MAEPQVIGANICLMVGPLLAAEIAQDRSGASAAPGAEHGHPCERALKDECNSREHVHGYPHSKYPKVL